MTGADVALIITSSGSLITAVGTLIVSFRNGQKADNNSQRIEQIHQATNGMKTELVNEVRKASFAAGAKSETDKQS